MDTYYFDYTDQTDAVSVFIKDANLLPAGVSVYEMPAALKNKTYEQFAEKYDVHFIFSDLVPVISFYAVPFLSVFAVDSSGGMIASLGALTDFESDTKIVYLSANKSVYLISENAQEFIKNISSWKENLAPFSGVELFPDIRQAKEKYRFWDIP